VSPRFSRSNEPPPREPPAEDWEDPDYAAEATDPELAEYEEDDEHEGRGLIFFLLGAVLSIAIIAGAIYGIRSIVRSSYLDQVSYTFGRDVSLLPARTFRPTPTDQMVRIFQTENGETLVPATRRLRRVVSEPEKARLILQEVFSPVPRGGSLRAPLPDGTRSRGFYTIGKTGYLDLSEDFREPPAKTPQGERLAVYSLVNSLVLNNAGVDAVQILVEGRPIETAWGWLDCSTPLGANLSIVE
jgi:hypothetical protein